jgi:multidrug resistance efflux pump
MSQSTNGSVASTNGELINRVKELRLEGQLAQGSAASRGSWLPWVLCGMMAVAWAGVGVRSYKAAEAGGATTVGAAARPSDQPSPATTAAGGGPPETPAGALLLQIKGVLTPYLQITLSPDDVAGVVEKVNFKEGDHVKKGAVLAIIRNNRYLNSYEGAKAALQSAKYRLDELDPNSVRMIEKQQAEADWAEAEANRVRCKQDLDRLTHQRAMAVVSGQDIDKAVADLKAAEARVVRMKKTWEILLEGPRKEKLDGAKADVRNAESQLAECDRLLKNCEVRAPIDGTILTKTADPGTVVSPTSFNIATGICTMADLSDLEAEIDVREDQINQIQIGQESQVAAIADPNRVYKGRVDRVMPIADDTKNTIKVRVKVQLPKDEEPGSFLRPKMSTVVRVYNTIIPPFRRDEK